MRRDRYPSRHRIRSNNVAIHRGCGARNCAHHGSAEPICAFAETNLVKNGDLTAGFDGAPADWYALSSDRKLSKFSWTYTPAEGGALGISNLNPNYASWHQALILRPGIYEISAEVRVEGAQPHAGGANIAVSTYDGIRLISTHLHGTAGWQKLSFFLKEDRWGDSTELLCQLGVAGFPDTGRASFRNIKVIAVASPPLGRARGFDLAAIRDHYKDQVLQPDARVSIRATGVVSRPDPAGDAGMGARRNMAAGACGRAIGVDARRPASCS